ncbi:phosphoribosylanthranilate isomerase [Gloeocapsa sp. PCC 73106]|uniref:phosphoribosylanthranilate isomerase n=1 Tax=Gloeocapsa sp. PCC 73106 TaxID=102232 RepID=UPI0002ABC079|nr:phosphoribosylanthranilate isomerase [Gloeocapsa sp. PCC 73106]ELR96980.1 phosphoribosylanthranilate isomerase [Gloeocapsa sp. PCC 73106]
MRVKICGVTQLKQAQAIANLGADTLGFICFPPSPRYLNPQGIKSIIEDLPESIKCIGVFVNASWQVIHDTVLETGLTGVQLHGDESAEFCLSLRRISANLEVIKALRVKGKETLSQVAIYADCVDTLLLDAYDPNLKGGTGKTLPWLSLQSFTAPLPWLLAGGLTPDNLSLALSQLQPDGIDLSSGVERSPGDKDLERVARLFEQLKLSRFT